MIIDSHIDMLWPRNQWQIGSLPTAGNPSTDSLNCSLPPSPLPARKNPYSPSLIRKIRTIALQKGMVVQQGCYLGTLGPTYETRSEYRFFGWAGADAVGMSTISEVLVARDLDMQVLAFSVITNVASTDSPNMTSHEDVVKQGQSAGPRLMRIVTQYLDQLSGQPD